MPDLDRRRLLHVAAAALCVAGSPARGATRAAHAGAPRIALALGGGGCRGFGHIGFLKALERAGYKPDLIVGSSVGSLVGALYAAGIRPSDLERHGQGLSSNLLRSWIFPKLGMFGGSRIARFVNERVPQRRIEDLPMRFAAVSTDLRSGELVILDRGDIGLAVQASSSLPGLLEPVSIGRRYCVDGNLAAPVPVRVARTLGATHVIGVDVTFPPEQADLDDPFDALYQGFSILTRRLAAADRAHADVWIEPSLPVHNDMAPKTLKALVDAGDEAATAAMPSISKLFARAAP